MLPANKPPGAVLCISIGAQSIEAGILAAGRWVDGSLAELTIDTAAGLDGLLHGISQLPLRLPLSVEQGAGLTSGTIRRIRVVVADHWLSVGQIPFSPALKRSESAMAFARTCLGAAGSDVAPLDVVRIDDGAYLQPRLAVVYPARLIAALETLAQHLQATLDAVVPLSVAAWRATMPTTRQRSSALAVVDDGLVLLVTGRKDVLDVVVRRDLASQEEHTSIDRQPVHLWERMRLRDPQWTDVDLRVLSLATASTAHETYGTGPSPIALFARHAVAGAPVRLQLAFAAASMRLVVDACAIRPGLNRWSWAAAAVIVGLSLTMVHAAWQVHREAARVAQAIEERNGASTTEVAEPNWTREELSKVRAVNAAVRQLNLPFSDIVRALEPPRDIRVAVLGLEVLDTGSVNGGSGPTVKVVAESKTGAEMARYVGFLQDSRPFADAYLVHHEIVEFAGERPFRFTVEVRAKS